MRKYLYIILTIVVFFSGCATNNGITYNGRDYNRIKKYDIGTVLKSKPAVITDDGTGEFMGILIGTVLGSLIGSSAGKTLATLGGGLGGYYAGIEIGKANGEELTVQLDNGEEIIIVIKGKRFKTGERIKIIKDGNRVAEVDKVVE